MKDILPIFCAAMIMFVSLLFVGKLPLAHLPLICLQTVTGVVVYTVLAFALRIPAMGEMMKHISCYINKFWGV